MDLYTPGVIEKKREGGRLAPEEITALVEGYMSGKVSDAQMSALCMAIFFQGLDAAETAILTEAMMRSGRVFEYPAGSPPVVDKHSTGGVGDKVSLILAPLLACDGVWVPMISGRGLGITGGTLDKMESIPGFRVDLDLETALAQLERLGLFMIGQTKEICPADRRLYALRDVTGTVPSRPLICASIMSKKLAENLDRLVLDVKFGSGAFMQTREEAELLASELVAVAEPFKTQVRAVLSPMEEPLGRTVGNALEMIEAVESLQGGGPPDLRDLVLDLAETISESPREVLAGKLDDGTAWQKWVEVVEAQGGDVSALEHLSEIRKATVIRPVLSPKAGRVRAVVARKVGEAAVRLGAGRSLPEDPVDFTVGFSHLVKVGESVGEGDPLAMIHASDETKFERAAREIEQAVQIES